MLFLRLKYFFFLPISWLWKTIYRIRRMLYNSQVLKSYEFHLPVISIGNLTFGGTGKTPFVIWVSKLISDKKKSPVILTRGYRGELESSHGIIKSGEVHGKQAEKYGDEAILLARHIDRGAVIVGKNRVKNLTYYIESNRPDAVILDDGFQHLKMVRNLNFVLFDCLLPISQYRTPPLGYFREGLSALKHADAIILNRSDQVPRQKVSEITRKLKRHTPKGIPYAEVFYRPVSIKDLNFRDVYSIPEAAGLKVIAATGLANPEWFFKSLESVGIEIIDRIVFADHHYFTNEDINELILKAKSLDCYIMVSEKDIVKIRKITENPKFHYLEIAVDFLSGKEEIENLVYSCTN